MQKINPTTLLLGALAVGVAVVALPTIARAGGGDEEKDSGKGKGKSGITESLSKGGSYTVDKSGNATTGKGGRGGPSAEDVKEGLGILESIICPNGWSWDCIKSRKNKDKSNTDEDDRI